MKKFIKKFLVVILVFIIGLGIYYKIDNDNSKKFLHEIVLEQIGSEIKYKYLLKNPNKVSLNLTKKQKLEDFDELVKFLDENFLYMDYLEKEYDIKNFEKKLRKALKVSNSDLEFIYILNSFFAKTKNIAHLQGFFDKNLYDTFKKFYDEGSFNYKVIYDDKVIKTYDLIDEVQGNLIKNDFDKKFFPSYEDIIEYKFIGKNTAYLKIKLLLANDKKYVIKELYENFYSKLEGYKNLIIDIRGNSGGDSTFGEFLTVFPILKEDKNINYYELFLNTHYNRDYLKSLKALESELPKEKAKEFLNKFKNIDKNILNKNLSILNGIDKLSFNEALKVNKNLSRFNGRVFLLVDRGVYSSAEYITYLYKHLKLGSVVGTNTSGDGLGIDPAFKSLKNSGIIFKYSVLYGLNPDGSSNGIYGTKPDIDVGNKDALEVVMELIKKDA